MTARSRTAVRTDDVGWEAPVQPAKRARLLSIDAARGMAIVVLLLAMHPGPRGALPYQLKHPEWHGLTFADLFFPLFLFAIGAAMPFSARASRFPSVLRRAVLLTVIGILLVSAKNLAWVLPGVLQHIAVAYVLAWLVLRLPNRAQVGIAVAAVLGYWAAFLVVAGGGDPWGRSGTFAHEVNTWVFGGFRTEGLPQTVISTVNVLAGAFATRLVLRVREPRAVLRRLALWTVVLVAAGLLMALSVPLNKRLWSPSYTVLTVGTSFGWFALAYWAADLRGWARATKPLVVLGQNAIAVYVVAMAALAAIPRFRAPVDDLVPDAVSPVVVSMTWAVLWLVAGWAFCRELHRRGIFIKV